MFKNSQKISIGKHFLISLLFIVLIFTSVGISLDGVCATDLNQTADGIKSELIMEDKLGNSQENVLNSNLEVDNSLGAQNSEILGKTITVEGGKFSDIQNAIDRADEGDTIKLKGTYVAEKVNGSISVTKPLKFTADSTVTLDGKKMTLIFDVVRAAKGSTFNNIKFINAYNTGNGGGIYVKTQNVKVTNCIFQDCYAWQGSGICTPYTNHSAANLWVENCQFISNIAQRTAGGISAYGNNTTFINCLFDSNGVYASDDLEYPYGGAVQMGLDESSPKFYVYDCKFFNNFVEAKNELSHGGAGCVRDGITYERCLFVNNSAGQGGALTYHASGMIKDCTFINNSASYYGGGLSTGLMEMAMSLNIQNCLFEGNTAPIGGAVQLFGKNIDIENCNFNNNNASQTGGAINIEAEYVDISDSSFDHNIANIDGGAVFINGKRTTIEDSSFTNNHAMPDVNKLNDGLGGAIYINSTLAYITNNEFYFNTARNGSAVYYDKYGTYLKLNDNIFYQNQAWVYALPIYAQDIYYGQTENFGAVIHGGNNIAKYNDVAVSNAIYNAADSRYLTLDGESPVSGATTSGHLYQDDREYNMDVLLTVTHEDGSVVYNKTLKSDSFGEVSDSLKNLKAGKYYVTAKHYEDTYYKAITNTTTFSVIPLVDVKIKKTATSEVVDFKGTVVWTLNVTNDGPNVATDVSIRDALPQGLIYLEDDTKGAYNPSTGILKIASLNVGEVYIANIKTSVNKTGEITNGADVSSKEHDYNLDNNHGQSKINVKPAADLEIIKSVNASSLNIGDLVKWTIDVVNHGPNSATGVSVSDVLPKSLIWVSDDGAGKYNHNSGSWNIGNLDVNVHVKLNIVCRVNATGTIKNEVSVSGNEYDHDKSNNHDDAVTNGNLAADLSIVKEASSTVLNYHDVVKWTLTVSNKGPNTATGVKISDVLPKGFTYINSSRPYSNGVVNIGNLAVGAKAVVEIYSRADSTGSFVNVASVEGSEFDPLVSNNRDDASVYVKPAIDLKVTKDISNTSPNLGDKVTWTLTVSNNGPDRATGVVVSEALPKSLIWVSDDGSGKYDHNTGKWDVGTLNVNGQAKLNIVCKVNATGVIVNRASVTGNEFDWNSSSNNDQKQINVAKSSDLSIVKEVDSGVVNYLDVVKWTLTVTNKGPDAATGVWIYDTLPKGFIYLNSSKPYVNGRINMGNLAVGAKASVDIYSKANITGTFVNIASVDGNEYDHNPSNNKNNVSVVVKPAADLKVTKDINTSAPNYQGLVKWTLTVYNNGPDRATGVVVSEALPKSLIWVSDDGSGKYNPNTGKWNVGTLNVNGQAKLNIVCRVNTTGVIVNKASVTGNEFDWNSSSNNDQKQINVAKSSDLSIVKEVASGVVNYLDIVKWTITVTNKGPNAATGVKINDVLPKGFVYINSSKPYVNGVINIGNLAVGAKASVDIYSMANITGSHVNVASVEGNEFDHDTSNNNGDASVVVKPAADLKVTKDINTSAPNYQGLVKWTLTVYNNGPDRATGVVVSEALPKSLIWVSDDGSGKYDHNTGKWNVGTLNVNGQAKLNIVCRVNTTGVIVNGASVTGNEFDWNSSSNNDQKQISVPKASDLSIVKDVSSGAVNYLDVVKWTITVTNKGPDAASGVKIQDVLPKGFVYLNSSRPYANGIINIGNLAVGAKAVVEIYSKANVTGNFVNVARVEGSEFDPVVSNNRDDASVNVKPAADLSVTKVANNSAPNYHDNVKWTLTVYNRGPDNATGVVVNEMLPKSLIWVSDDGAGKYDYTSGIWNVGNIQNGQTKTLNIITKVNGTALIENNVSVHGNEFDYNQSNINNTHVITVANASDLAVIKLTNASEVNYLQLVKWTIIASNYGPNKATEVSVEEILPTGLKVINYTATKGFYDNGIWAVCCIESGESQTLELICQVLQTGDLTNIVKITGKEYDHDLSNNIANESVFVAKSSDIDVVKTVDNLNPNFADIIEWTITVTNNGPDAAEDIQIMDLMGSGLNLIGYEASKGSYADNLWQIDYLANGSSESLVLRCEVNTLEDVENIAVYVPSQYDWNESNSNDSEKITVNPIADLDIIKLVNVSDANYLDLVEWTLIVTNHGPNDASNVFVRDIVPEGLAIVDVFGDGFYLDSIWDIGDLANGESRQLTIVCKIHATGRFTNSAYVWAEEADPNLNNNEAENHLHVYPASDLSIKKTVSKNRYSVGDFVKYFIKLTNNGPDGAKNIKVSEIMDKSLKLKSFHASSGDFDEVEGIWSLDFMDAGESATLEIEAVAMKAGIVLNKVSVTSDNFDPDLSNNDDTVSIDVAEKQKSHDVNSKNNDNYPENRQNNGFSDSILLKNRCGNPIMVIVLLFVFTMGALYGNNILKKR